MFDDLFHADWSVDPRKRWMVRGRREGAGWTVGAPRPVGPCAELTSSVLVQGQDRRILIGFDFPIGLPSAYGMATGYSSFTEILPLLGTDAWHQFFDVGDAVDEVSLHRPFYPRSSRKGVSRGSLVAGLGVSSFDELLRVCEKRTEHRQAACSLFWTLGGNQVGKGAISGWREFVRPALARGARLWPFEGNLAELSASPGVVMAETYPAEAYRMVDAGFSRAQSKRRQSDRRTKAVPILAWADRHRVLFETEAIRLLEDGFGGSAVGEDMFDALLGLLKMIEVADGRRPEASETPARTKAWEGWILGR